MAAGPREGPFPSQGRGPGPGRCVLPGPILFGGPLPRVHDGLSELRSVALSRAGMMGPNAARKRTDARIAKVTYRSRAPGVAFAFSAADASALALLQAGPPPSARVRKKRPHGRKSVMLVRQFATQREEHTDESQ